MLFTACKSSKNLIVAHKGLVESFENSTAFRAGFTGFALYDPNTKKIIWEQYADQYFTPASNTKILTLYTALKLLPAPLPGLRYQRTDSKIYFQGTGNPVFLNTVFDQEAQPVFQFLKEAKDSLVFCDCNFQDVRFGSGWSWDDYHYSFQAEKSPLPIYGNIVQFKKPNRQKDILVYPSFFNQKVRYISKEGRLIIHRSLDENFFEHSGTNQTFGLIQRPFRPTAQTVTALLSDTLGQPIQLCERLCQTKNYKNINSDVGIDLLFQRLMHDSDNFVAEQLLLMCANELTDTLQVRKAINWSLKNLFSELSSPPQWVDGSGLSRYNKITPRSIIQVLEKIYVEIPEERLFDIFPAGGRDGSIKDWYAGADQPYVFAKTGSLRHVHCLSGFVKTKNGRTLIFSFMHNNFTCPSKELKLEMEKVLQYIYAKY